MVGLLDVGLLGDLEPLVEVHVDHLSRSLVARAPAGPAVPVHEMVVFGPLDMAAAQVGHELVMQVLVRPQVGNIGELSHVEQLEWQFRISVLLGHSSLRRVAEVKMLQSFRKVGGLVRIVWVPCIKNVVQWFKIHILSDRNLMCNFRPAVKNVSYVVIDNIVDGLPKFG